MSPFTVQSALKGDIHLPTILFAKMDAYIKYLEYYLPQKTVSNNDLQQVFPEWDATKVAKKTGIEFRHQSAENETACDMAVSVCEKLFAKHPEVKATIDFILLCTQSPDFKLPTSACLIQDRLGLPNSVGALDFNLGCSGWVYGLSLAKGLLCTHIASNVLLITSETYTKYFHPKDKGNISLFGDGAAATVVSNAGFAAIGEFALGTDGSGENNLKVKTGGARFQKPLNEVTVDDNGYILASDYLYMNGPAIFNFTLETVPSLLEQCLAKNGLHDMADFYILHQANKFMLDTLRKICGIPKDRFYVDMQNTANTVSSTIPIALKDALDKNLVHKGDRVCTAGFGVGYSYGACVLDF